MGEKNQTTDEDENGNVAARHRELESDYAEMSLTQQPKGTHHRLRGRGDTSHRRLMETPDFDFQIKMYWKEGFCVSRIVSITTKDMHASSPFIASTVARRMERASVLLAVLGRVSGLA